MAFHDFIMIERDVPEGGVIILLVHQNTPHFTIQMTPNYGVDGTVRGGVIRRIQLTNSAVGGYKVYARLIAEAERFFERSLQVDAENRVAFR